MAVKPQQLDDNSMPTPSKSRPALSIVLPAYNEERNVAALAALLFEVTKPLGRVELVFVNDCSSDGTLNEIRQLAAKDERVRYISFTRNFGHQAALRAGLRTAQGDAVIMMDTDFEHPPELVPQLAGEWQRGAKVVVTQRLPTAQVSMLKRTTSRWYYALLSSIGDVAIEPGSADFLLLDREVVDKINGFDDRDIFLRGLVRWLGYPLTKVTFTQGVRREGTSSYSLRRMIDFALMGIVAHTIKPLRVAIHLSLFFALLGVLLLLYSILSFPLGHTVTGWTSIMSAIAILGAGQFLVLGIIGEYIGRTVREQRNWPAYLVAETESSAAPKPFKSEPTLKPARNKPATAARR
ncbi:MAG: glycosyltransferase family 2 protein [Pseudolabrys sp.]